MWAAIRTEAVKFWTARSTWVCGILLLAAMPLLGYTAGAGAAQAGLGATPATNPQLASPIPPLDYLGDSVVTMGQFLMIILGSVWGSSEFRNHELRSALLGTPLRLKLAAAKFIVGIVSLGLLSWAGAWETFGFAQRGFGSGALDLWTLSPTTWKLIGTAAASWTFLGIIAAAIATLCRTALIPLIALLLMNVIPGYISTNSFRIGMYFPTSLGNQLTTWPGDNTSAVAGHPWFLLFCWLVALAIPAAVVFQKRDVGSR
jgi:hypothetical protein